jgi:hypothetical protein
LKRRPSLHYYKLKAAILSLRIALAQKYTTVIAEVDLLEIIIKLDMDGAKDA